MKYLPNTGLQGSNFYMIERIFTVATENNRLFNKHFSCQKNIMQHILVSNLK